MFFIMRLDTLLSDGKGLVMNKKLTKGIMALMLAFCMVVGCFAGVEAAPKKTVKATSVKLNKSLITLKPKQTYTLKAKIAPKKATTKTLVWSTSNKKVATVSSKGKVTAKKAGKVTITVKVKGTKKSAKCIVKVGTSKKAVTKITLTPAKSYLEVGESIKLKTTVTPSNATNKAVTYSSSNPKAAKVDGSGKVTALAVGETVIRATAKDGSKKYGQVTLTVRASLKSVAWDDKSKNLTRIEAGEAVNIGVNVTPAYAKMKSIKYSTSDEAVARATEDGQLIGLSNGVVTVKASVTDIYGNNKTIELNNVEVHTSVTGLEIGYSETELYVGETQNMEAVVLPETASNKEIKYVSDNEATATVDEHGGITAVGAGAANISAISKENETIYKICHVLVKVPVKDIDVSSDKDTIYETLNAQIQAVVSNEDATDKTLTYTSSNPEVAVVDENGKVTAVKAGEAEITIHANGARNVEKKIAICVKPVVANAAWNAESEQISVVEVNSETQLGYVITPAEADATAVYSSDNEEIAAVSETGLVTAKKNGKATIKLAITDGTGNVKNLQKEITVKTSVTDINVRVAEKMLYVDDSEEQKQTFHIICDVLPETASNTKVTYASDNEAVATVSESGLVTAVGEGTAVITVTSEDGHKTKTVTITVKKVTTHMSVSTTEQLTEAFSNSELQVLTIKDAKNVEIPEGNHENVSLVVDSPEGHIENHAAFKDVTIDAVSGSTYEEFANNMINYQAVSGTVRIAPDSNPTLTVQNGAKELKLVNDGNIASFVINAVANIDISGESNNRIGVIASGEAAGSVINTTRNLDVNAEAKLNLSLAAGAETTRVQVSVREQIPAVTGLGRVEVIISETSEVENVVGENTSDVTAQKVNVKGSVTCADGALSGADVYLIPYRAAITEENIEGFIDENTIKVTSDDTGNYETGEMTIGNYYLYVKKAGYQNVTTTLVLTSNNNNTFFVDMIYMVAGNANAVGNITGKIINAKTGAPVEAGITLGIREGVNNLSGTPLQTTQTKEDGTYAFENLLIGQYTVQVIDNRENVTERYSNSSFNVVIEEGDNVATDNSISGTLDSEQVRFVLVWGDSKSGASQDLDSHLVGPAAAGQGQFHTYYADKNYYDTVDDEDSVMYANLDVDDTTWEGPETTTIYKKTNGTYTFYVHDYTNGGSENSSQMSKSQAVVRVYIGDHLEETYSVPNEPGTLWKVCEFDAATSKITPINEMSYWFEGVGEIGIDIKDKYTSLLGKQIDVLESIKNDMPNEEEHGKIDEVIKNSKAVLETAEDGNVLRDEYLKVLEFINGYKDSVAIGDLVYEDDIDKWYTDTVDGTDVLMITGYTEELPEFQVALRDETSRYAIEASDKEGYVKKVVVTSDKGYKKTYYISYKQSDGLLDILKVYLDEDHYLYSYTCVEGDEDSTVNVLKISGYTTAIPDHLVIKPYYKKAQVSAITDSDRADYDKMVTVTARDKSKTYYIDWSLSAEAFNIQNITSESQGDFDWDIDTEYNDEYEITGYLLYISGKTLEIPSDIKFTAYSPDAQVSDIITYGEDGSQKKITVTIGDTVRTYEIKYTLSSKALDIQNVSAVTDNQEYVTDYRLSNEYDDNDDLDYRVLNITGITPSLPDNTVISTAVEGLNYEIKASDKEAYEKMAVLTYGQWSTTYYINYSQDLSNYDVKLYGDERYCYTSYDKETINGKTVNVIKAEGETIHAPEEWTVETKSDDVEARIQDVPQEDGYEKFSKVIVVTYRGVSVEFYLLYELSESALSITDVTAINEEGNDIIFNWDIDGCYYCDPETEEEKYINVLFLYGVEKNLPENIKITSFLDEAAVSIEDSDIADYTKKVVIAYKEVKKEYYIKYDTERVVGVSDVWSGERYYSHTVKTVQDGEDTLNVIKVTAKTSTPPEEWTIEPFYNGATVTISDSDRNGYIKKVTITVNDIEKAYYMEYVISPDALKVSKVLSGQGEDIVTYQYFYDYTWDDNGDQIDCIDVQARTTSIPDDLRVECTFEEATSEVLDSDRDEYDKMAVISYGDMTRTYYITYTSTVETEETTEETTE